jgi:GxxExxY protein
LTLIEAAAAMGELLYPELSYKVVGVLFTVFKSLGGGLQEKLYQRAIKTVLLKDGIPFQDEVRFDIELNGLGVGKYYIDFVIDAKIALEIKARKAFYRSDYRQIYAYLRKSGLELGILARFGINGVETKRVLRGYDK